MKKLTHVLPQIERFAVLLCLTVLVFFTIFRFSFLATHPAGFFVDESSIGYNAYTLLQFGTDEYGTKMPVYFKAFGDYKNPIFIYSLVPLYWLFGVTIEATRLGASLWVFAALAVFFLILKLAKATKAVLIVSLFLAATSPWIFQLSRVAFEVASFPFFLLTAILSFYALVHRQSKSKRQTKIFLLSFTLSLGLLFYSYTSARVLAPLLFASGIWLLRAQLYWKQIVLAGIIFAVCLLPIALSSSFQDGALTARYKIVGLSNYTESWQEFLIKASNQYLQHFTPQFLLHGDNNMRHVASPYGVFFGVTLPFLIAGLYYDARQKRDKFFWWILIGLLLSPIPSALTIQSPHVLRAVGMFVFLLIFIWHGVEWFNKAAMPVRLFGLLCIFLTVVQSVIFLRFYTQQYSQHSRAWFDAGVVTALEYAFSTGKPVSYAQQLYPGTYATINFVAASHGVVVTPRTMPIFYDSMLGLPNYSGVSVVDLQSCFNEQAQRTTGYTKILQTDGACVFDKN